MAGPVIYDPKKGVSYSSIRGDRLDDAFRVTKESAVDLWQPVPMTFDHITVQVAPDATFDDVRGCIAAQARYRELVMTDPTRGGGTVDVNELIRQRQADWEEFIRRRDNTIGRTDPDKSNKTRIR